MRRKIGPRYFERARARKPETIKKLRFQLFGNQVKLADKAGISVSAVQKAEQGRNLQIWERRRLLSSTHIVTVTSIALVCSGALLESESSLNSDFVSIAQLLGVWRQNQERSGTIEAVEGYLRRNHEWLLIFDSANTPGMLLDVLPRTKNGHVVITSQAQSFHQLKVLRPLEVAALSPKDAANFLLDRTGQDLNQTGAARSLAQELGYFAHPDMGRERAISMKKVWRILLRRFLLPAMRDSGGRCLKTTS